MAAHGTERAVRFIWSVPYLCQLSFELMFVTLLLQQTYISCVPIWAGLISGSGKSGLISGQSSVYAVPAAQIDIETPQRRLVLLILSCSLLPLGDCSVEDSCACALDNSR